jgi:hypothetical protein
MTEKQPPSADEIVKLLTESYLRAAERASDIAYARRSLYEAYLAEGFTPAEALELCKII